MKFDTRFWKHFARWLGGYLLLMLAFVALPSFCLDLPSQRPIALGMQITMTILFLTWAGYDVWKYILETREE